MGVFAPAQGVDEAGGHHDQHGDLVALAAPDGDGPPPADGERGLGHRLDEDARRELLERLPFVTGYGVDVGLLLDAYRCAGLDGLAQVDLEVRQNAHQSLRDLGPMASAVLQAVASRLEREGRLKGPLPSSFLLPGDDEPLAVAGPPVERPPIGGLRAVA